MLQDAGLKSTHPVGPSRDIRCCLSSHLRQTSSAPAHFIIDLDFKVFPQPPVRGDERRVRDRDANRERQRVDKGRGKAGRQDGGKGQDGRISSLL